MKCQTDVTECQKDVMEYQTPPPPFSQVSLLLDQFLCNTKIYTFKDRNYPQNILMGQNIFLSSCCTTVLQLWNIYIYDRRCAVFKIHNIDNICIFILFICNIRCCTFATCYVTKKQGDSQVCIILHSSFALLAIHTLNKHIAILFAQNTHLTNHLQDIPHKQ